MRTKNQILDRLQELDELHSHTPAQWREFCELESALTEIYASEEPKRSSNIAEIVARQIGGEL